MVDEEISPDNRYVDNYYDEEEQENKTELEQAKKADKEQYLRRAFEGMVAARVGKDEANSSAIRLGLNLRQAIDDNKFEGSAFWSVMILSIIKDLIDIGTLASVGLFGSGVNAFVSVVLLIVFLFRKSILKKFLIKKYVWPIIVEFIPLVNAFPSYTVSCILLKIKMNKKKKQLEDQFDVVNKEVKKGKKGKITKELVDIASDFYSSNLAA